MRQIIALGGGGFSMEPDNPLLDLYILAQTKKQSPKVCFVPTASGDSENYISRFYNSFESHNCVPSHLSLFSPPSRDLEDFVMDKDVIYVGGGNTKNLIALWKDWSLDIILKKAWQDGIVMAGISAGSICWFEAGVTDSFGEGLEPLKSLGFLKGSNCPHYDGEADRRPTYQQLVSAGQLPGGFAADDGAALHFIDGELSKAVSSRRDARAYQVQLKEGSIKEEALFTEYLG
ncbi:Type 1 glutamine amidotransferase-like domain-containing protein [Bacillus sp. JJ1122]|uniref:Type 1 glutamine amidotransferase-like domain-containing protein n=1 Tax=Bacillus sp. JJ1122 TaxID=3122951 RepID=UPI003000E0DE